MEYTREAFIQRWLTPLAAVTGRSPQDLAQGLLATDFPLTGVRIGYEDGSVVSFRYAFALQDPAMPGRVAVFTEHCGYHEFLLSPDDLLTTDV